MLVSKLAELERNVQAVIMPVLTLKGHKMSWHGQVSLIEITVSTVLPAQHSTAQHSTAQHSTAQVHFSIPPGHSTTAMHLSLSYASQLFLLHCHGHRVPWALSNAAMAAQLHFSITITQHKVTHLI